ncbi:MAG: NAD(P)-dependent glycerol-3-phosphate dehydrogenase [Candidatus Nanopelagicales bacterium]|jgi:glycerol-3-phosphate dehydrogenase (NAD(P)+)|nr:NAD(P)-dependent glycerol-3-phosphate dehydrogenase [Candidatus Nanopelagicales bacterium]
MTTRAAIMGSGSWGTAFAMVLADAGSDVMVWGRDESVATDIAERHRNETFHPGIALPERVRATTNAAEALAGADLVVLALPAQVLRTNLDRWRMLIPTEAVVVSLIKGIEINTTRRMSEVICEVAQVPTDRVAVVSGPNLAREIAERQPTATTVACVDATSAQRLQDACTTDYFRPYWTTDVVGTEIGGAVKNVIALANGMAVGMGLGENTQASLMTRGLAEMSRLGMALGADPLTFQGLAGVGDLVATCQSPLSRNRTFGENLGQGRSVAETIALTKQTCEAYKSCQPILELGRAHGVDMPITEQVVAVLHHGRSPREIGSALMSRHTKPEVAEES